MNHDVLPYIGDVVTDKIDGLSIRYARIGKSNGLPVTLTAPWPESIYSFHRLVPQLAKLYSIIIVDLPGFGLSQSRPDVMAPEAMGAFFIKLLKYFDINRTHVVAPDVGTLAVLFAAAKQSELFESLVIGGGAMQPDLAAGVLKDLIYSSIGYLTNAGSDGVKPYLDHASQLTPPAIIEDFRAASAGHRLENAAQFVRAYIQDCPKLESLLPNIQIPCLIIAGKNDPIVPSVNSQFLADRLPNNRNVSLNAEHRVWEEAADEYNNRIVSWLDGGYRSI